MIADLSVPSLRCSHMRILLLFTVASLHHMHRSGHQLPKHPCYINDRAKLQRLRETLCGISWPAVMPAVMTLWAEPMPAGMTACHDLVYSWRHPILGCVPVCCDSWGHGQERVVLAHTIVIAMRALIVHILPYRCWSTIRASAHIGTGHNSTTRVSYCWL